MVSSFQSYLADANHRHRSLLFQSLKRLAFSSHIQFLSQCKRRNLFPRGFRCKNLLSNTYPSQRAQNLAVRQSRQWLTLAIREAYIKLNFWSRFPIGPLNYDDFQKFAAAHDILNETKSRKLTALIREDNNQPIYDENHTVSSVSTSTHPNSDYNFQHLDTEIAVKAFSNKSSHEFSNEHLELLQLGPSFVPERKWNRKNYDLAKDLADAAMESLKRQIACRDLSLNSHNNSNNENNQLMQETSSPSLYKYVPPFRRTYGHSPNLMGNISHSFESFSHQVKELYSTLSNRNNRFTKNIYNIISDIKSNNNIKIIKSDKTQRLVAIDTDTYHSFFDEHLSNYVTTNATLPITTQQKFNRKLSEIGRHQNSEIKMALNTLKCSEPLPNKMKILVKDHKTPLRARPVVSAIDSPGTSLSMYLADALKPLLSNVSAHLKDTSEFISSLYTTQNNLQFRHIKFGSLDVTNLYGSIPLSGEENVFDVVANFFENHKESTTLSTVSKLDLMKLLKLAILNDTTFIKDTTYVQQNGLAMGNNLSPLMAIIYMHDIENRIKGQTTGILYWKRYIDDIFFISNVEPSSILSAANSISLNIKFTLETPDAENKMPFLDTMVKLNEHSLRFETCLYVKPIHSNHILPYKSNVPMSRKTSILKTENLRAIRTGTSTSNRRYAQSFLARRFIANGYPIGIVNQAFQTLTDSIQRQQTSNDILFIKLLYVSDHFCTLVRRLIRRANLPFKIRVSFIQPPNLANLLKPSINLSCGSNCICSNSNICNTKNCVYIIKCLKCNNEYCGETSRTIRSRIKDHLSQSHSNVYKHFQLIHNILPSLPEISFKILEKNFVNTLHRQAAEKRHIQQKQCLINVQLLNN